VIDDSLGDEVRVTVIAAGFDAAGPSRKPVVGAAGAAGPSISPGASGKLSSSLFDPIDAVSMPAPTNGATVRIGGEGGIADDDVDVPPFMRH
jgi:cell division protein FtsZ